MTAGLGAFEACTLPDGAKRCFLKGCRKVFKPRKTDQRFCSAACKADFYAQARAIGVKALESKGAHSARIGSSERLVYVVVAMEEYQAHEVKI